MAGNYEKGMYNQLMEVMARLDHVERESRHEISKLNIEISDFCAILYIYRNNYFITLEA